VITRLPIADELSQISTEELKNKLWSLPKVEIQNLLTKVLFYQNECRPCFEELGNPFPSAEEQASIVIGVWVTDWSTIPFKTFYQGVYEQSYKFFTRMVTMPISGAMHQDIDSLFAIFHQGWLTT